MKRFSLLVLWLSVCASVGVHAQQSGRKKPLRGSVVEDRAARKLLDAGDTRYDADETKKAVEVWQSVIERYPRSRVRFVAHMRLGNHLLDRERSYDRARPHFEVCASEENRDEDQRAEATLRIGVCYYEARNFGKCFKLMRLVIETYPVSSHVNQAYHYIGLGHFQLGHYSRAIQALEKVGTAFSRDDKSLEKVEAGKRLFLKIEDADLAALEAGETVKVLCRTTQGDEERVDCIPVGRNVRLVLGSIPTRLGKPRPQNGTLEIRGDDKVEVVYIDRHTADRKFDQPRKRTITVVGNAVVQITDGAFLDLLEGVVLGKEVNLQVIDPDRDVSDAADKIRAVVEVYRRKTQEEVEAEIADLTAKGALTPPDPGVESLESQEPQVDPYKRIDGIEVQLAEVKIERKKIVLPSESPAAKPAATEIEKSPDVPENISDADPTTKPDKKVGNVDNFAATVEKEAVDNSIHTAVFRVTVPLMKSDEIRSGDGILQAQPGDIVRLTYRDEVNTTPDATTAKVQARCIEGNIGGVRVTRAEISDEELRLRTRLKTAGALTEIGNRYKEFGLKKNAGTKYAAALQVCEEIVTDARKLGGRTLEETYVQLWKIYFQMDKLGLAAAMCQRLQREFPESGFVDEAMLQLAHVSRTAGDLKRAISVYTRLVNMKTSSLRGEAQFGIAECYEQMAQASEKSSPALYERAFQEYKKVFESFPDSGRVGEAVAKMANFYYQKKDYSRAIDVFETVLGEHPDAKFLDVILFNYGRCLYRMERKNEARRRFDQLIAEFPESTLIVDAKRISDALNTGGF